MPSSLELPTWFILVCTMYNTVRPCGGIMFCPGLTPPKFITWNPVVIARPIPTPPNKAEIAMSDIYLAKHTPPIFFFNKEKRNFELRDTVFIYSIGFHYGQILELNQIYHSVWRDMCIGRWNIEELVRTTAHCDMLHWLPFGRHIFLGCLRCPVTLV